MFNILLFSSVSLPIKISVLILFARMTQISSESLEDIKLTTIVNWFFCSP